MVNTFNKIESTNLWVFFGIVVSLFGFPILLTPLLPLIWLWDQDLIDEKHPLINEGLSELGKWSLDIMIPLSGPLIGVNSEVIGMFRSGSPIRNCYEDIINEMK